ncbi:MAG: sugar transferase [Kiritimatiellaeota bacterium]|nr:sugar transferase [Kiritimatiellota bacterium]
MKNLFRRHGRTTLYLMTTDWLILVGTFGIALRIRHFDTSLNIISRSHIIPEALFAMFYALLIVGLFASLKLYRRKVWLTRAWHGFQIVLGAVLTISAYMLLRVVTKSPVFIVSRAVTLNWGILLLTALFIHRLFIFPALLRFGSKNNLQRRVVIIGTQDEGIRFAEECLRDENYSTLKPIGFLCDHCEKDQKITGNLCCTGHLEDLPEIVDLYKIEGAVITPTDISYTKLMNLIEQCIRYFGWVDVHTDKSAVLHENLDTDTYFDIPFVRMREIPHGVLPKIYKEALDVIGATIGIILLSPILIATAVAIKLTSPGPVFYTRDRIGKNGKPFPFYKFRSMAIGADKDESRAEEIAQHITGGDQISSKIINESYVTPVGKFIRKWAIDELPQLFNVLKGDMSLVGPRPVPPEEHEMSDEWHKKRFEIKPGCTGLWKVYASRTGVTFNHTVLYDIYYARNMNPILDAYIILGTIKVILSGKADG